MAAMSNITIEAPQKDNSLMPFISEGDSCRAAVALVAGDDTGAPVLFLKITVKTQSGKTVVITIPNDVAGHAVATVDGEEV